VNLVIASNNPKKRAEMTAILDTLGMDVIPPEETIFVEVDEDGESFARNAQKKAEAFSAANHCAALGDDSGLCVEMLNGAPGVYSSRFAGIDANDVSNNARLLREMKGTANRKAYFVCCVHLVFPNGQHITAEGRVDGEIMEQEDGPCGFGYDPLFYCRALGKTFARATVAEKASVSHRGRALAKLTQQFNIDCRACPRLAEFLDDVRIRHPEYHCAPVPAFGDDNPRLLIVGLAPGMHGANRTGRPFTGDFAGILLYQTLFDLGASNQPASESANDALRLNGVRITNSVKCLPPRNKPETSEIRTCNRFLKKEIEVLPEPCNLLALGKIAHDAVLRAYGLKLTALRFTHGVEHVLPDGRILFDSYHCSRYNTQTRRLTRDMFMDVLRRAVKVD